MAAGGSCTRPYLSSAPPITGQVARLPGVDADGALQNAVLGQHWYPRLRLSDAPPSLPRFISTWPAP